MMLGRKGLSISYFALAIVVIVLMILFFIFSVFFTSPAKGSAFEYTKGQSLESRILMDLFLTDTIKSSEVPSLKINVPELPVLDALKLAGRLGGYPEKQKEIIIALQKKFNDAYSCSKKNRLIVNHFSGSFNTDKWTLIDYPSTFDNFIFPIVRQKALVGEYAVFCSKNNKVGPSHIVPGAFSSEIDSSTGSSYHLCILAAGGAEC